MIGSIVDAHPLVVTQELIGQIVVFCERAVDEGVAGVEEFENRAVALNQIDKETDWFLEHGLAQLVSEFRKAAAIDAVVLFEATKVEPVAAELDGQAADAVVKPYPPRLRRENFRLKQIARPRVRQKLGIRHAGPEEVAQAAGELVGI